VITPTYNNVATLLAVLNSVGQLGLEVFAIDDGSTDETALQLAAWADPAAGRHVVTHPANEGKAAALRSGFEAAGQLGFTHAATIDTDGQHDPADLQSLLALGERHPDAIIVGTRPMDGGTYPARSRIGRQISNHMVRLLGGIWVQDSQCGLRLYPLKAIEFLRCRSGRYAFETEVLIRAGWADVAVQETPIRCIYHSPETRVSHFKPWRDSCSAAWMHMGLAARSLWPVPPPKVRKEIHSPEIGTLIERFLRWLNPLPTLRGLRRDSAERERFSRSIGAGAFVAMTPPLGFKTIACLAIAKKFRLQPAVMLAVSSLQTPPIGIPLAIVAVHTGHLLLTGRFADAATIDAGRSGWSAVVGFVALCWIVGGVVSGAVIGFAAYAVTRATGRSAGVATVATATPAAPSPPDSR
jgi:uncharacterized protein (DUF2062 family)